MANSNVSQLGPKDPDASVSLGFISQSLQSITPMGIDPDIMFDALIEDGEAFWMAAAEIVGCEEV